MARMLDVLRQSEAKRNGDGATPPEPEHADDDFVSEGADEEVPFIEVGPARRLRVFVVDADEARPAVAERLGLRGRPGLAEVLAGTESLDRALQETGVDRLAALTAGQPDCDRRAACVGEAARPVLRLMRDR